MLKYLRLKNFRTCVDTEVEFSPVTLLIGRNNTGKSNICQALRFLSACASAKSIDEAARTAKIAPSEVVTRYRRDEAIEIEVSGEISADGTPIPFTYSVALASRTPDASHAPILTLFSERLIVADPAERVLLEGDAFRAKALRALGPGTDETDYADVVGTNPVDHRSHLSEYYWMHPLTQAAWSELQSWRRYALYPNTLRGSRKGDYDAYLKYDGSNLASVLFTLNNEDTRRFQMLLELVREIEPSIFTFNFIRPRPEEVWMEVEDTEGNRYGPESLSDGTLNYIAMCYVALQGQIVTHRDTRPPGLVCFEEPENGLWVGHLRRLFEVIQEGGKSQQMILTTHNPYLIDLFDDNLDQVRLVRRGNLELHEGTTVERLGAARVGQGLEHFSLGEQYFREILG